MPARTVVAAVIERDGRFLVAQRPEDKSFPLEWEFPGGKVEPGESSQEALVREIREELAAKVAVGAQVERVVHDYGDGQNYELLFFSCRLAPNQNPTPQPGQGVRRIAWIPRRDLASLNFLEGNRAFARKLASLLPD